jgi:nucleotide-binding universal stress UspA family protein
MLEIQTIQTILFPTDFSECSNAAFHIARALARDYHARLLILHVATPPPFVTYGELEKVLQRRNGYKGELEELLRRYQVSDERTPCDLIVMGTEGRTGLGRLLLGSVAEAVMRQAPCPVMAVKVPLSNTPSASSASRTCYGSST